MESKLAARTCGPCDAGAPPLRGSRLSALLAELGNGWRVVDEHHLVKTWSCGDFAGALAFTNLVGEEAEAQGHHPDVRLSWGRVVVEIHTHRIDGLTENDFILAARIDARAAAAQDGAQDA
jgi:4a-hydroxytetrahydrobiopterin dehydratase